LRRALAEQNLQVMIRKFQRLNRFVAIPLSFGTLALHAAPDAATAGPKNEQTLAAILDHQFPRLAVVMTFDQLRMDYLLRFSDQYLPAVQAGGELGGWRWLMENGAFMTNAHYTHLPTFTGPGHATILTGAGPSRSGIISNDWMTSVCRGMNCVEDLDARTVGGPSRASKRGSSSPVNLMADTVGDVLRLNTNRLAKVVGIGIKDRGPILLTGHNPSACVWFDSGVGNFVTSSYYGEKLPAFAAQANEERLSERWLGKQWDYLLPKEAYERSAPEGTPGAGAGRGLARNFPKPLSKPGAPADSAYFDRMIFSPFGNELVLETAKLAIKTEDLGRDEIPDMLCLSFSTHDFIGHTYGPNSPEVHDLMLRADRQVADFLNHLKATVPGGLDNVLIVIASDHGVAPLPDWARESMRLDAARVDGREYTSAALEALQQNFGDKLPAGVTAASSRMIQFGDPYFYFNAPVFEQFGIDRAAARRVLAERIRKMPGAYAAYTRDEILGGQLPKGRMSDAVTMGYSPERSGDVILIAKPFQYATTSSTGTTHGTVYTYDTNVPIVFAGKLVRPGMYTERADVRDIAPTLALMLGQGAPAAAEGTVLDILK